MSNIVELRDDSSQSWRRPRCHPREHARRHDYADLRDSATSDGPVSGRPGVAPPAAAALAQRIAETAASDPDDGVELIYTETDTLLRNGSFTEVDELLAAVDESKLPTLHLLAMVSITYAARDRVTARVGFVARGRRSSRAQGRERQQPLRDIQGARYRRARTRRRPSANRSRRPPLPTQEGGPAFRDARSQGAARRARTPGVRLNRAEHRTRADASGRPAGTTCTSVQRAQRGPLRLPVRDVDVRRERRIPHR